MNRIRLHTLVLAASAVIAMSLPAVAAANSAPAFGEWHRNNYNAGEEQLFCRESAPSWTCRYDVPDGTGWFTGRNVTSSWTCPEWFPDTICDNVTAVYEGTAVYLPSDRLASDHSFMVPEAYVVTEVEGTPVLQLYWVDRFVCPWYRTYDEALAHDFECVFGP
jgi:hypothetical protein